MILVISQGLENIITKTLQPFQQINRVNQNSSRINKGKSKEKIANLYSSTPQASPRMENLIFLKSKIQPRYVFAFCNCETMRYFTSAILCLDMVRSRYPACMNLCTCYRQRGMLASFKKIRAAVILLLF